MHLSMGGVENLVAGRLEAGERKRAVRHLLTGCKLCGARLAEAAPEFFVGETFFHSSATEDAYDAPIDRAEAAALAFQTRWREDRERLARGLDLIRKCPEGYDGLSFEQVQELQGRPLVEALLQLSFELRFRDPERMRWLAYNAMTAAEDLRPEEYERGFTVDLRARTWADLANAYKVNGEFLEAEQAFGRARVLLRQGTGDLFLLARVATLEASLRCAQRRLAEACELLEAAYRLYLKLGDSHLAGKSLVLKAISVHYGGNHRQAVELLRHALSLVDSERDPQLLNLSYQCLLDSLIDSSELHEAGRLLLQGGLRKAFASEPVGLLKLRWVEGKLLAGLGRLPSAERALVEVRSGFLERGREYDAALAGLDLAAIWMQQKKTRQVRQLSQSMLTTFQSLGIQREALKARRYLEEASQAM